MLNVLAAKYIIWSQLSVKVFTLNEKSMYIVYIRPRTYGISVQQYVSKHNGFNVALQNGCGLNGCLFNASVNTCGKG